MKDSEFCDMSLSYISVDQLPKDDAPLPNTLWPFIWYFVKQVKWVLLVVSICYVISTTLLSLTSYFVKLFVDALDTIDDRSMMVDEIFWVATGYVVFCVVLQSVFWRIGSYLQARNFPHFTSMGRRQLALYMNDHSYAYFQDDFAGRLSSKVVETPRSILAIINSFTDGFIHSGVSFIVSFVLLAMTGLPQLLIIFVIACLYAYILRIYLPKLKHLSKRASDQLSHVRGCNVDILTNILNVKLFARKKYEDGYFLSSLQEAARRFEDKDVQFYRFMSRLDMLMKAVWVFPAAYALYAWQNGNISTGDVAMVLTLSIHLGFNMWGFTFSLSSFFENLGQVQEGMETITKIQTVKDKPDAKTLQVKTADIDVKGLDFSYGKTKVFEDFDLHIPAGQKVGLIGPSGAGKSSLMHVLLRLYDVQGGAITIDGQNIADVQQDSLRENIAVIPQSTDLLHRTLRENIGYGCLGATQDDIISAAKRAYAHDFVLDMKDKDGNTGYDAMVGERGVKLSGGQRQRVAIARAILKEAPILILDEATSALDSESEKLIQAGFKKLMEGKTVIAIAHRLSTIVHLDRLIVMDDGKIIEDGTHKELLEQDGLYARLWSMQSGGFLGE